jgi:hypothetical protein
VSGPWNVAQKLVRIGLGWDPQELPKREPKRYGKLSQNEILQLVGRDAAHGADGRPVMHGRRIRIAKRK